MMISALSQSLSALTLLGKTMNTIARQVAGVQSMESPGIGVLQETEAGPIGPEKNDRQALASKDGLQGCLSCLSQALPKALLTERFYQSNLTMIRVEDEMLGSLLDTIE
jgi:hypothetical protein